MLVNTRIESDNKGFNPNVDNTIVKAKASLGQKIGWYTAVILGFLTIIIGIILVVKSTQYKNYFQKKQIEINNAAGTIDLMLVKRKDTLIKLLEQTKAYLKHEKNVLTDIASLRSIGTKEVSENEAQRIMDNVSRNINLTFENYPNLKANTTVLELMSASQYLESEIASARRLYNQNVTEFNSEIFIFPKIVMADKMNLSTFAFFAASESQKQDVDMSSLNN